MLKRLAIVSAAIGALGTTAAFAEPTLEFSPGASPGLAATTTASPQTARAPGQSEAFRPTAATRPAVLQDPDSHANTNP